ncbi:helix-turn-helix domain-containing protein [Streptomyces sp. NPDC059862]|uniref:helix-turn-helix domain-containing protein n=1 Tax=Streptomyces sp. NPDC059862 TaxID=3346975 RepID=UPI003657EF4A
MALSELRKRLTDGLAHARLTKTQLARQAKLGRTTVQQAVNTNAAAPTAETVAALARTLRLPVQELLDLQRTAAGADSTRKQGQDPGKPISEWDPHDLEVHPAGPALRGHATGAAMERVLPGYVPRNHDRVLADVVDDVEQGHSHMVVLVGSSSTGKTRACWEAVQPLAQAGWLLWHPFDPTRAEAALDDLQHVRPHTVIWLNEAQHYLGPPDVGERIAAAIHDLLTKPQHKPVLVLGTLWPHFATDYMALPAPGAPDPHSRVRELLAGRTLAIPETFDTEALCTAAALAEDGDRLLADALTRAADGRVTQDLAGAPELLRRYETGTAAARAVLEAAMDARRLGVGLHLPHAFLIDAAIDYLCDQDYDELTEDWVESAFAELARVVHGKQAPLRRVGARPRRRSPGSVQPATANVPVLGQMFRLADYLDQHGRTTRQAQCPPASFWEAAYTHLAHTDDLDNLAEATQSRFRYQWAHHLRHRAIDAGSTNSLAPLAWIRETVGDHDGAEALYRRAADAGSVGALAALARMRKKSGDHDGANAIYRKITDSGESLTEALSRRDANLHAALAKLSRFAAALSVTRAWGPPHTSFFGWPCREV